MDGLFWEGCGHAELLAGVTDGHGLLDDAQHTESGDHPDEGAAGAQRSHEQELDQHPDGCEQDRGDCHGGERGHALVLPQLVHDVGAQQGERALGEVDRTAAAVDEDETDAEQGDERSTA